VVQSQILIFGHSTEVSTGIIQMKGDTIILFTHFIL